MTNNGILTVGATRMRRRIASGATRCCGTLRYSAIMGTLRYSPYSMMTCGSARPVRMRARWSSSRAGVRGSVRAAPLAASCTKHSTLKPRATLVLLGRTRRPTQLLRRNGQTQRERGVRASSAQMGVPACASARMKAAADALCAARAPTRQRGRALTARSAPTCRAGAPPRAARRPRTALAASADIVNRRAAPCTATTGCLSCAFRAGRGCADATGSSIVALRPV